MDGEGALGGVVVDIFDVLLLSLETSIMLFTEILGVGAIQRTIPEFSKIKK